MRTGGAEEFAAVVDASVAVAVEGEETAAGAEFRDQLADAVGIEVEGDAAAGQCDGLAGEIDDQRIAQHDTPAFDAFARRGEIAAHRKIEVERDAPAVGGTHLAAGRESGAFVFFDAHARALLPDVFARRSRRGGQGGETTGSRRRGIGIGVGRNLGAGSAPAAGGRQTGGRIRRAAAIFFAREQREERRDELLERQTDTHGFSARDLFAARRR